MKSLLQDIGDYHILEKLGRGGMADVYLALEQKNNRRVALKLVERGEGQEAQEIVDAERVGAALQQHLSQADPRVPQIHAFGDLEGYFFINMEFVEGRDLSALIGSHRMTPEDAAVIAGQLCSILHVAHGMSLQIDGRELRAIVHGDIKPKNIRIDNQGNVRVLDFGIAKGLSITRRLTSNVFGSIAYSSPERLESGSIDELSDLWSVGIVLYEMVEQRLPFEAASSERLETIIRSHTAMRPLANPCPEPLQQIIYKSLARSPGSRYQNAAQFESDLHAFLSGELTLAAQENELTRRTVPAEDIETRRTLAGEEPPALPRPDQETVLGSIPVPESRMDRLYRELKGYLFRTRKWIVVGVIVLLAIVGIWEGTVMRAASLMKPEFVPDRLDGDSAWNKYQGIRGGSLLGFAPLILRAPLRDLLMDSCERDFSRYRNSDTLRVREGDWVRCKRYMSRAVQLGTRDRKAQAMLEYANGHLLRINRKGLDAVAAFQHASALQPQWPDPYLGLARTYIYAMNDMERGAQALERAQQLGHQFGKRDQAMLADAYRKRGLQDIENANMVRGSEQEKEYLKKAKNDLNEALKIYLQIMPVGDSAVQILSIRESLGQLDLRLSEMENPNPLLPWNWFK
jgi:eukaryotic-like serine/threonine-protein kinase